MLARRLFLVCASALVFLVGVAQPIHNWDMIGYVASAYFEDGYRGAELSSRTYEAVRAEVGSDEFAGLTQGEYVETVFKDPSSLEQQLPFYSIRVVYVELMRGLKLAGVEYPKATYLISAVFAALSVIVLGAIISAGGIPFLALPVVLVASGYVHLSQLSTPDALACFFSLWAMYCLLSKQRLVFLISAILPLMRTDSILLCALIMAYEYWRGQKTLSWISFLCSLAAYVLINRWHGNYGWLTLFNFNFIQSTPFPADLVLSHRLADYWPPYVSTFLYLLIEPGAQTLIYLLCIYVLVLYRDEARTFAGLHAFIAIPVGVIVLRLLLFPNYEDRYFVFPASMILAGTLGIIANGLRPTRIAPRAPD
jgi:hypothetical protein